MIAVGIVIAVAIVYFNPPSTISLSNYQSQSQSTNAGGGGDNTLGTVMSIVGVAAGIAMLLL
jgi:hypothetical protein